MYPTNITDIHLELSDKCQAACPMCSRNWYGGKDRDTVTNTEITLEQFKEWFPVEFLGQLRNVYACGNMGDPLLAKDCLEIFEYLNEHTNDACRLGIHTNGSLRNKDWWTRLGTVMQKKGIVVFGIDGFAGTHELYRKHTDFNKIIENAKAFIAAGGIARADTIAFKHNEHQLEDLQKFLLDIGFNEVNIKTTQRFHGIDKYPVQNKEGVTEYYIEPPTSKKYSEPMININMDRLTKPDVYKSLYSNASIVPDCIKKKEVYVDSRGMVFPCCQVAATATNDAFDGEGSTYVMRSRLMDSAKELVNGIGILNLNNSNIVEQIEKSNWHNTITHYTTADKKLICIKACATNIRTLVEGTDSNKEYVKFV